MSNASNSASNVYVVDTETKTVYRKDGNKKVKAAIFDEHFKLTDFWSGESKNAVAILKAMKEEKALNWKDEEYSDNQIKAANNIWELHPHAPNPEGNEVGDQHPEIHDWCKENYPNTWEIRYKPYGRFSFVDAGMGRNKTKFRDLGAGPGRRGMSQASLKACEDGRPPLRKKELDPETLPMGANY